MAHWEGTFELRRMEMVFARAPSVGVMQDVDICTFHFLNLTSGDPDSSWTNADYALVEGQVGPYFWVNIKDNYGDGVTLHELRWRADGPRYRPFGTDLSPTLRVTPIADLTGTSSGVPLPPQCAMTVTEVTDAKYVVEGVGVPGSGPGGRAQTRNRWGRFYLPAMTSTQVQAGRWSAAACADIATAVETFYNELIDHDIIPVLYSPTTGNAWSITEIHVDDIIDVVRSRRYVTPLTRTPKVLHTP